MTPLSHLLTSPPLASLTPREARTLRFLRRWRLACIYHGPGEAMVHVTRRGRVVLSEWHDQAVRERRRRVAGSV